jgi:hypothetical protein
MRYDYNRMRGYTRLLCCDLAAAEVEVEIGRVAYDVEPAAQAALAAGLPAELAETTQKGH